MMTLPFAHPGHLLKYDSGYMLSSVEMFSLHLGAAAIFELCFQCIGEKQIPEESVED